MKKFIVDKKLFEKVPNYCLGIVVARGIDNKNDNKEVTKLLDKEIKEFAKEYEDVNIRELPHIKACRDAFQLLDMNPNKYMCSIESLTKRVQKKKELPHINNIVDLSNAISIKYIFPLGAHDIDTLQGDMELRFTTTEDTFTPLGEDVIETLSDNEVAYVSNHIVKTRRWLWRQSNDGKKTEKTTNVFFPIDGFVEFKDEVLQARDELAKHLKELNAKTEVFYIDKDNNEIIIEK